MPIINIKEFVLNLGNEDEVYIRNMLMNLIIYLFKVFKVRRPQRRDCRPLKVALTLCRYF